MYRYVASILNKHYNAIYSMSVNNMKPVFEKMLSYEDELMHLIVYDTYSKTFQEYTKLQVREIFNFMESY
jgi:hypothetical protein